MGKTTIEKLKKPIFRYDLFFNKYDLQLTKPILSSRILAYSGFDMSKYKNKFKTKENSDDLIIVTENRDFAQFLVRMGTDLWDYPPQVQVTKINKKPKKKRVNK